MQINLELIVKNAIHVIHIPVHREFKVYIIYIKTFPFHISSIMYRLHFETFKFSFTTLNI